MINRLIKISCWLALWLLFFWVFIFTGFPEDTARDWVAERLGKEANARVSIEEAHVFWDLDVRFKGISIIRGQEPSAFDIKLASLDIRPKILSLIRLNPTFYFSAITPSGGDISGSYDPAELYLSFKDISFGDISISTIPVPSVTTATGSGRFKLIKGTGTVEIEVDGIPGGKQRLKAPGGEAPGLDGKLKVTVSLPKL